MSEADPAAGLRRRGTLLGLAALVPLLALVAMLAWREYGVARDDILQDLRDAEQVRRAGLEQLAIGVDTHIAVMRSFAEQRLAEDVRLPPWDGTVDWPPDGSADPGASRGLILADPASLTEADRREITAVSSIFALARATHATRPYLRWSYFFAESRHFVAIYPWATFDQMLDPANPAGSLASYFTYDLYTQGEPAANPDRTAYWTPVYVDAGGAGLMVTHAAPVWTGDRFRGVVGTDVLLAFVGDYLASFPAAPGQVVVVDQAGNLIATSEGSAVSDAGPVPAAKVLGDLDISDTGGAFVSRGAMLVSSAPIAGTPFHLVMTLPEARVRDQAAGRLQPFALVVLGIVALFAAVAAIFNRQFVTPAIALSRLATRPADLPADLPAPFRPLANGIVAAAEARAAQTAHLRAMVDGVPLRVVYLDAGLIYRDANREFLEFIGRSRDEVIGAHVRDVLGPEVEAQYQSIAPMIRRGQIGRFEGWIAYKDQGRRFLQVSILPFRAPGEAEPGYLTFTRDLTDLKEAEQEAEANLAALAEREDRYRSVVVSALDGIIVMNDAGVTTEFNPAAEAMFGYPASEAIGQKVGDLIVPTEARHAHNHGMDRYLVSGVPHVIGKRIEVEAMRRDGSRLPVELTVTEMQSEGRRIFVSHLRDLTEPKRLEREMQEGRERLHQVEKLSAMGSLLAGVAHELNNPLAIAVAQSTLLVDKAPDDATRQRAERIRAAAERCGRIVKSFLAMARQKPPQRERLDLPDVIHAALDVVGYSLRSAGVEVETRLPAGLPAVSADRDLLGQVFSNILVNAQQALTSRPMPRLLRITARAEGAEVLVRIEDNGPGVSDAVRHRIFDPYFTTKAVEVGTGIGLSISRNVIETHGGTIGLGTGDLPGACFDIRLPALPPEPAAEAAGAQAPALGQARRILIVDDEPDVAASLAEMLEGRGHAVTTVATSATALDLLRSMPFDALFTDLRMPGMDGAELALRATELRPGLLGHVVLMTGDTVAGPARTAELGLSDIVVLEKPFLPDDVTTALAAVLG
ncbi:PAS domain S-box protein [Neotabrizicola shimadae]|uniref:histidine kinase n=1 Tax=Neotabrizicola shimadae TaxID=2807096 RepID=A0A8G1ECJ0_9RHOB|nr:PAS domain S-box protein [Neotabrizicola shimadae]QYZ70705.1 PAS domain S-box protein [Neotabrizicola shimadae]